MADYRRLPGGDTPEFQKLRERLEHTPALARRLALRGGAESSRTVRRPGQLEQGREVSELTHTIAAYQELSALLHEHPILKGNDRSAFVLDWLDADAAPKTPEGVFQQSAVEFLIAGARSLSETAWPLKMSKVLVQVAFGFDATNVFLRELGIGRRISRLPQLPRAFSDTQKLGTHPKVRAVLKLINNFRSVAINRPRRWPRAYLPGSGNRPTITNIDPSDACPGEIVTITGSAFGRPYGYSVMFAARGGGCVRAEVVEGSWTDNTIQVRVPDEAGPGCIGFMIELPEVPELEREETPRDELGWPELMVVATKELASQLKATFGSSASFVSLVLTETAQSLFGRCPECLPGSVSWFTGGLPIMQSLTVDGRKGRVQVERDTDVVIAWRAIPDLGTSVRINITELDGTTTSTPGLPATGSLTYHTPFVKVSKTLKVTASASSRCGSMADMVEFEVTRRPNLAIAGIEVVQAIQRYDIASGTGNNVRLVAGKRTAVRLYVDSGVRDGFDYGYGPNNLPGVTGRITVVPEGARYGIDAGLPWFSRSNSWEVVTAQPRDDIERNRTRDSLNFEIPLPQTSGRVAIQAKVWVEGHQGDNGGPYSASETISVTFLNQPTQAILPYLIEDQHLGLPAPTMSDYYYSLQGAISRFPIAEDGFIINPPIRRALPVYADLRDRSGWDRLLMTIATEIFIMDPLVVGIRGALVPDSSSYDATVGGVGTPMAPFVHPAFVARGGQRDGGESTQNARTDNSGTYAHEMGHTLGIFHAPCGNPPGPIDSRLPAATEDTGMDIAAQSTVPSGTNEIMSYCGDNNSRWPSIAFWDIAFNTFPI